MTAAEKQAAGNGAGMPEEVLPPLCAPVEDEEPRKVFGIQQAKELLAGINEAVDHDDPVLLLVHLHHGFLGDYEKMLERHQKKVKEAMAVEVAAIVDTVDQAMKGLRDETLKSSLSQTLAQVAEQVKMIESVKTELLSRLGKKIKWGIFWHGVLALVTAVAATAMIVALANI